MSIPAVHARNSSRKFGGVPEDYIKIHEFMDQSKASHPTVAHRSLFHHSLGAILMESVFGNEIKNSDGNLVGVRTIAEQHIIEDLGFLPTFDQWASSIEVCPWMAGVRKVMSSATKDC